jgi:hypothetical protein
VTISTSRWYRFIGSWMILSVAFDLITKYAGLGGHTDMDTMTRAFLGSILLVPDEVFRIERKVKV